MNNLAINGGAPVRIKGWEDNNTISDIEIRSVVEVLKTGRLSGFEGSFDPAPGFSFYGGKYVQQLENDFCNRYGLAYGVSFNSASSAIFASIAALGLGYGDEVIVSPATMSACAPYPLFFGAIPIFADVDAATGCIDPKSFRSHISKRTKAIILVHQFGIPADMLEICKIAKENNIAIIEDCAQSYDAKIDDRYVGTFSDISIFSLNINKTIHSGEGGVCLTNNERLKERLCLVRNHGENVISHILPDKSELINMLGLNLRMTEIQAVIGVEQLKKLTELTNKRLQLASYLKEKLRRFSFLTILDSSKNCHNVFYQFVIQVDLGPKLKNIQQVVDILLAEGIFVIRGQRPLYYQPIYQEKCLFKHNYPFNAPENQEILTNYEENSCPVAEKLYQSTIICEHVRSPHSLLDMDDIVSAFAKIEANFFC